MTRTRSFFVNTVLKCPPLEILGLNHRCKRKQLISRFMHQRFFFSVPDLKPTLMSNLVTVCFLCAAACSCILLKLMFSRPKNVSSRKTAEIEKNPEFVSRFSIFQSVSFWKLFFLFCFKSQGPTLLSWTQHVWRRERLFFCTVCCVFIRCAATFLSFCKSWCFLQSSKVPACLF